MSTQTRHCVRYIREMSCVPVPVAAEVCANCGKEGSDANDAVKLKNCTACFLVKYCSVDCQAANRKQHKKACKERVAELKDEKLYSQGHERAEGGFCLICLLAIPFPTQKHSVLRICCMKTVCAGCCLATVKGGLGKACPFCRTLPPTTDEGFVEMIRIRAAARDPQGIRYLGDVYASGMYGLQEDEPRAFQLWSEAAELGSTTALRQLGVAYSGGRGVAQDNATAIRCWESAAVRGDMESRFCLGGAELLKRKYDRAVRHFMISAKMGHKYSLDKIKKMFADGVATKAQYAEGLKGYQDAVEEMKSSQRDEAMKITKTRWKKIFDCSGTIASLLRALARPRCQGTTKTGNGTSRGSSSRTLASSLMLPVLSRLALLPLTTLGEEKGSKGRTGPQRVVPRGALPERPSRQSNHPYPCLSTVFAKRLTWTHVQQQSRSHALSSGALSPPSLAAAALLRFPLRSSADYEESPADPQ
ncbi:hypothetical protein THAOC_35302, partial [Thalassiosira oceanica]